jgi:hypothetical protein
LKRANFKFVELKAEMLTILVCCLNAAALPCGNLGVMYEDGEGIGRANEW